MNILIIGNGGREHALAWKIKQSPHAGRVFVAPGNAGTAAEAENVDISATDFPRLIKFAQQNDVALTVVGPETPLVAGIVDAFTTEKLRIFGPSKAAAELEGSKVFCKNLLRHADVPSADFQVFRSGERAIAYLKAREDMLGGCQSRWAGRRQGRVRLQRTREAIAAVTAIATEKQFGEAGNQLIIEERLDGHEASVLAITDGRTILTLPAAQDHKAAFDGDRGPNTGGMGAYSPTPLITEDDLHRIEEQVLVPTVHALKRLRRPFRGVLYAGLMMTGQGPKVLEFNVRFGDPECQPLLMRLQSDLVELIEAVVDNHLDRVTPPVWDPRPAVCVVMASAGYPGKYERGFPIRGLDAAAQVPDVKVFHSGTATDNGNIVTNGGRVLAVTALGNSIPAAKLSAYTAVKQIRWQGAWCRKDISDKAQRYVRSS